MRTRTTIEMIVAVLLFIAGWFVGGRKEGRPGAGREQRDTIIVYRTKAADKPVETASIQAGVVTVPAWAFFTEKDTVETERVVTVHDTLYLPREQKYYCEDDGRLRIWVSGYEPALDRWELDEKETTITVTKRPRWTVSLGAGYGAGKDGLTPIAGVTIGYNLFSF